jgi:hypothetical protein
MDASLVTTHQPATRDAGRGHSGAKMDSGAQQEMPGSADGAVVPDGAIVIGEQPDAGLLPPTPSSGDCDVLLASDAADAGGSDLVLRYACSAELAGADAGGVIALRIDGEPAQANGSVSVRILDGIAAIGQVLNLADGYDLDAGTGVRATYEVPDSGLGVWTADQGKVHIESAIKKNLIVRLYDVHFAEDAGSFGPDAAPNPGYTANGTISAPLLEP